MIDYGYEYNYAATRLNDSLVLAKVGGRITPIFVEEVDYHGKVYGFDTLKQEHKTCNIEDVITEPVKLGFCEAELDGVNSIRNFSYVVRGPSRLWKQGLISDQVIAVGAGGYVNLKSTNFARTVLGIYPKASEAFDYVSSDKGAVVAFGRSFALASELDEEGVGLEYRYNGKVGVATKEEGKYLFKLEEKYKFLQEELDDVLGEEQ